MVQTNLTRFALTLVLLGFILAVAVIRPRLPLAVQVSASDAPVSEARAFESAQTSYNARPADEGSAAVAAPDEREAELARRESELLELEDELNRRRTALDGREDQLEQQARSLQALQEQVTAREGELDQRRSGLANWEASLVQREQRVRALLRWSLVTIALNGLTTVAFALVARTLVRRGRQARESRLL